MDTTAIVLYGLLSIVLLLGLFLNSLAIYMMRPFKNRPYFILAQLFSTEIGLALSDISYISAHASGCGLACDVANALQWGFSWSCLFSMYLLTIDRLQTFKNPIPIILPSSYNPYTRIIFSIWVATIAIICVLEYAVISGHSRILNVMQYIYITLQLLYVIIVIATSLVTWNRVRQSAAAFTEKVRRTSVCSVNFDSRGASVTRTNVLIMVSYLTFTTVPDTLYVLLMIPLNLQHHYLTLVIILVYEAGSSIDTLIYFYQKKGLKELQALVSRRTLNVSSRKCSDQPTSSSHRLSFQSTAVITEDVFLK